MKPQASPRPGTENIIRWFVNFGGKMYWADSIDELWELCGKPNRMVREHEDETKINFHPKSFRFIPLTIYDNPILLKNNPGYLANLLSQPRVNQMRFLHGSWTAKAEGSGFFSRDWCEMVDQPPVNPMARVRSWDLAASVPSETAPNPDWTAGVKMSRDKFGIYYIEDCRRFRKLTDGVLADVISTAERDGFDDVHRSRSRKTPALAAKLPTASSFARLPRTV
jgi:hypothetical protein